MHGERDCSYNKKLFGEGRVFQFEIIPKIGALHIAGGTIKGYSCRGHSRTENVVSAAEVARVNATQMLEILLLIHFESVNPMLLSPKSLESSVVLDVQKIA